MAPSKMLTVFGATSNQGGSVVSQVFSNAKLSPEYKLLGVALGRISSDATLEISIVSIAFLKKLYEK